MALEDLNLLSRRERLRLGVLLAVLIALIAWATLQFLNPGPPRRLVLASGADFGLYHGYAKRYQAPLAREGVKVGERMTSGAAKNLQFLLDPKSGVEVAFFAGGSRSGLCRRAFGQARNALLRAAMGLLPRQGQPPGGFASEAYTLREYIGLVRRAVAARASAPFTSAPNS